MKNRMSRLCNEDGFTLIEILVVTVIFGILVAIAVPSFNNLRKGNTEDMLVVDGKKLNTVVKEKFESIGGRTQPLTKSDFPNFKPNKGSEWAVASMPTGYCVGIWHPDSTEHKTQSFAYIWEGSFNACQALGFSGELKR